MDISSHTLVKNGAPFIEPVLRNVIPYMTKCFITVSKKSKDGTIEILEKLKAEYPDKIILDYENVTGLGELTEEKNKQISKTKTDWIMAVDDDDWWPKSSMEKLLELLDSDLNGFVFKPFQVINKESYDATWRLRWFMKLYRNKDGLRQAKPWPKDVTFLGNEYLYWRFNNRVKRNLIPYFHLSYIKSGSFRNDCFNGRFKEYPGITSKFPEEWNQEIERIFSYV